MKKFLKLLCNTWKYIEETNMAKGYPLSKLIYIFYSIPNKSQYDLGYGIHLKKYAKFLHINQQVSILRENANF